jgi:MFS family permease
VRSEGSRTGADAPPEHRVPARGLRAVVSSFRHRNFRLFFVGQLISLVGTWMQNVAQSWLVYDLTRRTDWLGAVSAAGSLPMLFLALYAGVVTDRRPKRSMLVLTAAAAMLLALILAALAYTKTITVWHVLVLAFLLGSVNAFDMPARQAFVIEMVGREDLMNCIALNSAMFNGARIAGPAIAAQVLLITGVAGCFFVNGLSYIAVIIALLLMRLPAFVPPEQSHPALGQMREAFAYIRRQPMTLTVITLMVISGLFGSPYQVLMPVYARTILKVGARGYGQLLSASGVGALLGALAISLLAHRPHKERLFFLTVPVFTAAALAFAWCRWLPLSLALLVVASGMMMMQFATANTLVQTYVPDALRGRVLSVYILAFQGTWPFGSFQLGRMAKWLGPPELGTPRALALSVSLYGLLAISLLLARRRALAAPDDSRQSSVVSRQKEIALCETHPPPRSSDDSQLTTDD